jgi:hypothetical protein
MSRVLSLLIAVAYLIVGMVLGDHRSFAEMLLFTLMVAGYLLIPFLCIWFPEEMGNYTGSLPGPSINRPTPEVLVRVGGWFLLLLPAIIGLFVVGSDQ